MINGIPKGVIEIRLRDIDQETPGRNFIFPPTKEEICDEARLATRTAVRNNLMLDTVLTNQQTIIANQNKILEKLDGQKLDTVV